MLWKPGSLFAGEMDVQRVLRPAGGEGRWRAREFSRGLPSGVRYRLRPPRPRYNLHRKQLPTEMLQQKATTYVEENLITQGRSDAIMAVIMAERGDSAIANDQAIGLDDAGGSGGKMLTLAQLQELLAKRERQMQEGGTPEQPTDQCASGRALLRGLRPAAAVASLQLHPRRHRRPGRAVPALDGAGGTNVPAYTPIGPSRA